MAALRLFLPDSWTNERRRLERALVPADYRTRTKPEIALAEIDRISMPAEDMLAAKQIIEIGRRASVRDAKVESYQVQIRGAPFEGEPVGNAEVEVWQANSYRRYTHPSDTNPAPLDPNFEGLLTRSSKCRD
jgi:hypothetical protein